MKVKGKQLSIIILISYLCVAPFISSLKMEEYSSHKQGLLDKLNNKYMTDIETDRSTNIKVEK